MTSCKFLLEQLNAIAVPPFYNNAVILNSFHGLPTEGLAYIFMAYTGAVKCIMYVTRAVAYTCASPNLCTFIIT